MKFWAWLWRVWVTVMVLALAAHEVFNAGFQYGVEQESAFFDDSWEPPTESAL